MAIVKNFIGGLSGRVGDKIYRNFNGKIVVSSAPTKYVIPNDPESVARREKFLFISKIASAVLKNFIIKNLWAKANIKCISPYHKFIKINRPIVDNSYNVSFLRLIPNDCMNVKVSVKSILISKNEIVVEIFPLSNSLNLSIVKAPIISVQGVLFFMNADKPNKEKFLAFPVSSDDVKSALDEVLTFNIKLDGEVLVHFDSYPLKKALLCMIMKTYSGEPFHVSNSFTGE